MMRLSRWSKLQALMLAELRQLMTIHSSDRVWQMPFAAKHGATREEIAETLGVAIAVNAGVALVYSASNGCFFR